MILTLETMCSQKTNDTLKNYISSSDMRVCITLREYLEENDIMMKDIARLTGIRMATLSELVNGKKSSIEFIHLLAICSALGITDINKIIKIKEIE